MGYKRYQSDVCKSLISFRTKTELTEKDKAKGRTTKAGKITIDVEDRHPKANPNCPDCFGTGCSCGGIGLTHWSDENCCHCTQG